MSRVAARFQNQEVALVSNTVRGARGDIVSSGDLLAIKCEYTTGNKSVRDDSGVEFIPDYVIYTTDSRVQGYRNKYLLLGDAVPRLIRAVKFMPALPRMGGGDYVLYV